MNVVEVSWLSDSHLKAREGWGGWPDAAAARLCEREGDDQGPNDPSPRVWMRGKVIYT
jgi:hypothetical protein